jgi:hypothetical protein
MEGLHCKMKSLLNRELIFRTAYLTWLENSILKWQVESAMQVLMWAYIMQIMHRYSSKYYVQHLHFVCSERYYQFHARF